MIKNYYDPDNTHQNATLDWQGPGYYAANYSQNHAQIQQIAPAVHEGSWPKAPQGFGTVTYAGTPDEAAGNYTGHEV